MVVAWPSGTSPRHIKPKLSAELLVLDPVRDDGVGPQPPHLVRLVVLEIALEPFDVAVALERQNVRRDAVEEEAIVADDDGAAGETECIRCGSGFGPPAPSLA